VAETSVARLVTRALRKVERDAAQRPAKLRGKITVPPRDDFYVRTREGDDGEGMFENVLVEMIAHAPPGAAPVTPARRTFQYFDPVAREVRPPACAIISTKTDSLKIRIRIRIRI